MTRPRAIVVAALVALAHAAPERAWADDGRASPSVREAADHFERGVKLYEEQDWRAALIEFERAYSIAPHYAVLYNVGQCRYQLKDYAGSLAAFEKYMATGGAEGAADQRARVETTLADLRRRVARLSVTTDVDGVEIAVDDVVVGTTPLPSPLVVSEGRRRIVARKTGYSAAARELDVAGSDATEVKIHLEALAAPEAAVVAVPRARGGRPLAPTLAMFGFAAGGIGVGAAFGLVAMGNKNDLDAECSGTRCPPSAGSTLDALKRNAVISTIGFSVGAAGLVAGAGYLLFAPSRTEAGTVRPFIGPGVAGAAGSFW